MTTIFQFIGMITTIWFATGVAIICTMSMDIPDNCPWGPRLRLFFVSSFYLPYLLFTMGIIPRAGGILESDQDTCQCPKCRARRGE